MSEHDESENVTSNAFGFWSYAHDDNERDGGAILKLAGLISREYDLLSGEPLQLFVDHDSLAWGDEWRRRIDEALTQTTFLIPIITPRYFTRPECRRELLEFAAKARSLGVEELLLPILYVKPANFTPENPDEAVALVARMQYVDWTGTRLLDYESQAYKSSVNKLALKLINIAETVAQNQFDREIERGSDEEDTPGIQEIMDKVSELLPAWLDAVIGDRVTTAQVDVTWHQSYTPVIKLQKSHAPASAIMAAQVRAGKELLLIIERHHEDAQTYLARSAELDPLVSTLSRLVAADPEGYDLVMPLREAIDEAMENILRTREPLKPGEHSIMDHIRELKHRSRVFQRCGAIWLDSGRLAREGNVIVRRWNDELSRPNSPEEVASRKPIATGE